MNPQDLRRHILSVMRIPISPFTLVTLNIIKLLYIEYIIKEKMSIVSKNINELGIHIYNVYFINRL
uniref:Uncharacterized protein n=1 Tax=Porphyridium purpureum TaxID=35688 RepID=W0RYK6_PORPP|nr:hypothetical protein Y721_p217 [Porphyridium purpureum]BAO23591.1 hypothetical protein [Porphyridium purpureum]